MQFLTDTDCTLWLKPSGIAIDQHRHPIVSYAPPVNVYALTNPKISSPYIMRAVMDWLPVGRERLIFILDADTYPLDTRIVFEAIRRGCGATSELTSTPGHLFLSTKGDEADYDDRPAIDVAEESIAMWIGGLALDWTWAGMFAVKACPEFIELGDGYLRFVSPNVSRLKEAIDLAGELGLQVLDRFPWQ